ncbi:MAG: helix-turn-helix domain-containing protein [Thiotrichales bacterium]
MRVGINRCGETLLTRKEAADYLVLSKSTLESWASESPGKLPFVKIAKKVFYKKSVLDRFIKEKLQQAA